MDPVHDRGSMDPVHESGPWTRSKVGVHGPLVHVLSSLVICRHRNRPKPLILKRQGYKARPRWRTEEHMLQNFI